MQPSHFHAPGLPAKLPDGNEVRDKQGRVVFSGKTRRIGKLINDMREHHRRELTRRRRG